jgi:hypothetical protein
MKICIITGTCRKDPRFAEMAATIKHNAEQLGDDVMVDWIVVDEHLWREDRDVDPTGILDNVDLLHVAPAPSTVRGPDVEVDLPDLANLRNSGFDHIEPDPESGGPENDYVLFLDDCHILETGLLVAVAELAKQGHGFRGKLHSHQNLQLPPDGGYQERARWDKFRPVKASTVPGACWGAPLAAFAAIKGFDMAYAGESKFVDLDACTRLERTGVRFFTTERAWAIELRATKGREEISTRGEAFRGDNNRKTFAELGRDRSRIAPSKTFDGGASVTRPVEDAGASARSRAVTVTGPVGDARSRAETVVGGPREQPASTDPDASENMAPKEPVAPAPSVPVDDGEAKAPPPEMPGDTDPGDDEAAQQVAHPAVVGRGKK